jgi:hypothetical protein
MRIYHLIKVSRSAVTGRFVTARWAHRNPSTTVVETVRVYVNRRSRGRAAQRVSKSAARS